MDVDVTGYMGRKQWIRSGGSLDNVGGSDRYTKDLVCPDGCVLFQLRAKKLDGKNPFTNNLFR